MQHLQEYNDFKWFKERNPFTRKSSAIPKMVINCSPDESKSLIVDNFIKFLNKIYITNKLVTTGEEGEDYILEVPEKQDLNTIYNALPEKLDIDNDNISDITIWYLDDPDNKISFKWAWQEGVYR